MKNMMTALEIIQKWANLQRILIKKEGDIFPHEKWEKTQWLSKDYVEKCIDETFKIEGKCRCPHCKKEMNCYGHHCSSCIQRVWSAEEDYVDYQEELLKKLEQR